MTALDAQSEVGQFVAERPSVSRIFEKYGIDYCCGGKQSLESACQAKGLATQQVLAEVNQALRSPDEVNLQQLSQPQLVEHIVTRYHGYLRDTLPMLTHQVDRVAMVHGPNRPELLEVQKVFHTFMHEMLNHMEKEEQILFPMIASQTDTPGSCPLASIIQVMEAEHDDAGEALACMRRLTNDYSIPEGACGTYRAVLRGLAELEQDTHLHVHAENHVLFPRALGRA